MVSGRLPGGPVSGQPATLQVAVTPATAARFGLRPGSRLGMDGTVLLVTGIVRPVSPGSPFWTLDPDAAAPTQNSCGRLIAATYWLGAAFAGQDGMPTVLSRLNTFRMQLTWDFPLDVSRLTADQAPELENELTNGLTQAGQLVTSTNGQPTLVGMSSGLADVVAVFVQEDRAVGSVLSLLYVSLTVIGGARPPAGPQAGPRPRR